MPTVMSKKFYPKAIETRYAGYRMRSRLEARWAVFFDAGGWSWEYEVEGFTLSDGRNYLPDFCITATGGAKQWVEIKPTAEKDDGKMQVLASDIDRQMRAENEYPSISCITVTGDPHAWFRSHEKVCVCPRCGTLHDANADVERQMYGNVGQVLLYCWTCDNIKLTAPFFRSEGQHHKGYNFFSLRDWDTCETHVLGAALAARAARFEFGENGRTR